MRFRRRASQQVVVDRIVHACLFALVFATLFPSAPASAQDAGVAGVLARVREASGSPWRYRIASHAAIAVDGRPYEERTERQDVRSSVLRCTKGLCSGTYVDGDRLYLVDFNGTALPQATAVNDRAQLLAAITSGAFAEPAFAASGGAIGAAPAIDGRRTLAVRLRDARLRVSLDGASLVHDVRDENGNVLVAFDDYRRVGPVMLPFTVRSPDGARTFDERTIVPGFLGVPSGLRGTFRSGTSHLLGAESPRFACTIAGRPITCLLDTGSWGLAMSLPLAETLGLEPFADTLVSGVGLYATGVVTAGPLDLGTVRFERAHFSLLTEAQRLGYDAIVGADVLAHAAVALDATRGTIAFVPSGTSLATANVPLVFAGFSPLVPIRLGTLDAVFTLDTGDQAAIDVSMPFFTAHKLFAPTGRASIAGVGGSSEQITGVLPAVTFGGATFANVPAGATDARFSSAGRVGYAFLRRFPLEIDYAQSRLGMVR